ncbi:Kinesin-like protein kif21b [Apophysomyces ossiformis]|uniref:Kinesin-like protein kif21b n=1 Tax=Apophysomyces ossiformis TaxID=679940 RepID=A0A8H7ES57_9FUNG|nr:Kinesin-like protein kif21b [Apophysomyces ossiformis]
MGTALDGNVGSEQQGIIPRFITDLFVRLATKSQQLPGFDYQVYVTFLELYNEDLVDLLNMEQFNRGRRRTSSMSATCEISIREDVHGNIYWSGVREEPCANPHDLLSFLEKGSMCRTTGSTDMNAVSSRSHAIFSVILKQQIPEEEQSGHRTVVSKFHFTDLAGSERVSWCTATLCYQMALGTNFSFTLVKLKRTNAQGERAREGIAINAGLLALGNVISALGDGSKRSTHVPYRDSKLTRLLQDSLGGNSQTLMMACVSPSDSNFVETLSTLKYANRARNIKNRAVVNQEFAGASEEVNQLRSQILRLKAENEALRSGNATSELSTEGSDNMRILQEEVSQLRIRVRQLSDELCQVTSHRDSLLMERDQSYTGAGDADKPLTHPMIMQYQQTIQNLRNELADAQERLAAVQSAGVTGGTQQSSGRSSKAQKRPSPQQHTSSQRRRVGRKHRNGSTTTRTTVAFRSTRRSKVPNTPHKSIRTSNIAHSLVKEDKTNDAPHEDLERWLKATIGSIDFSVSSDVRADVRDSIEKTRAEIEKGLKVLEDVKEQATYECDLLADDELFERLQSEDHLMMFDELEHELEDHTSVTGNITCQESNDESTIISKASSNTKRLRMSSCETTFSFTDYELTDIDETNPQIYRMIDQIQSDIRLKEELVAQLEKSETEYSRMRKKFAQKLYSLRDEILDLKNERDQAMQQPRPESQRKNQQLIDDVKQTYEKKISKLVVELDTLKRKYSQTSSAIQSTRCQNETMLRALQVNLNTLRTEKQRILRQMKDDANRVREKMVAHEREIQRLRRKQARDAESKRRLEREHRQAQAALQKRADEVTVANEKTKQLIQILKRAVQGGGVLNDELLSKCAKFINVNTSLVGATSPRVNNKRKSKKSNVPVEVRASRKKDLLDRALFQFIHGKQAILEMKQLISKRDDLAQQKSDLLSERESLLAGEEQASEPLDCAVQQFMDERLETIEAEILYLNDRICSLQNDAAHEIMEDDSKDIIVLDYVSRAEKRVTFADKVNNTSPKVGATSGDEWSDVDNLEENFLLPRNADPDTCYDMAVRLLKSLAADESERIMETLIDDVVALRMGEYNRQITVQQLEKTVQDLRRTLIVMKKAAKELTIENEKKMRKLEDSRRASLFRNGHITDDSSDDHDSAIDLQVEEHYQQVGTIFDKIYNDGIRGNIMSPTWNEYHSRADTAPSQINRKPSTDELGTRSYLKPSPPPSLTEKCGPLKPSISPLVRRRDSMTSPEQFLHQFMQGNALISHEPKQSLQASAVLMTPADFVKYQADRESSTSSLKSSHKRRSSIHSDTVSWSSFGSNNHSGNPSSVDCCKPTGEVPGPSMRTPNRRRALSFQQQQQPPRAVRHRWSMRELSSGMSIRDSLDHVTTYQTSPLQQEYKVSDTSAGFSEGPLAPAFQKIPLYRRPQSAFAVPRATKANATPFHQRPFHIEHSPNELYKSTKHTRTASSGSVFDRLANVQTTASRAKRSPSSSFRHSSSSFEEIRRNWDLEEHELV